MNLVIHKLNDETYYYYCVIGVFSASNTIPKTHDTHPQWTPATCFDDAYGNQTHT